MLKDAYPKVIADLLGIPPIPGRGGPWMSSEGTVMRDWLMAVGEALDVPYAGEKTRMMRALVEAVGGTWDEATMSSRQTISRGGGNITTEAFAALLDGLRHQPPVKARLKASKMERPYEPLTSPGGAEDRAVLGAIQVRAGQPQFRARLLEIYEGRCAITDCDAPEALEAAHVIAYGDEGTYDLTNGLLLRADIHTLFDKGLFVIDEKTRRVILHPSLRTSTYAELHGRTVRDPCPASWRVRTTALLTRRRQAGF